MKYHYAIYLDSSMSTVLYSSKQVEGFEGYSSEQEATLAADRISKNYPMPQHHKIIITPINKQITEGQTGAIILFIIISIIIGVLIFGFWNQIKQLTIFLLIIVGICTVIFRKK